MKRFVKAAILASFAMAAVCAHAQELMGTKPKYVSTLATSYPNAAAVTPRIWAPDLDEGWVPQGLVVIGKHAYTTAYQDAFADAPKCRVFQVELETGKTTGMFDVPDPCKHAGGIVDIGGGFVVVIDTSQNWRVDLAKALAAGNSKGATKGMIKLGKGFGSSFGFFDGKDLWDGTWYGDKDSRDPKIYRVELGLFDNKPTHTVTEDNAVDVIPIPKQIQGAALDKDGNLWLAASQGEQDGKLYRIDRKTGAVLAKYEAPPRIENISFDANGKLWAISEAGALKYAKDRKHFPVIFEIDVAKLK